MPQFQGGVFDAGHGQDGGVVDQYIEAAEVLHGGLDNLLPVAFAGNVVTNEQGVFADFGSNLAAGFFVEIGEHYLGAFTGQQQGVFTADAAGGASDDTNFTFYTLHCCSPDRAI
ncbi:hypothetical protein D3C80_1728450 [compost metagenome]